MIAFCWALSIKLFDMIPLWVTHGIWLTICGWLLLDSFLLASDLKQKTEELQRTHETKEHYQERLDCLERHIKSYILYADMDRAFRKPSRRRLITRSASVGMERSQRSPWEDIHCH